MKNALLDVFLVDIWLSDTSNACSYISAGTSSAYAM